MSDDVAVGEEPEYEEKLDEKPRSILMAMIGQLKSGMDLSRVTLPTFILEPRSFLEKGADNMAHGRIIASYPPRVPTPQSCAFRFVTPYPSSNQPAPATSLPPHEGGRFGLWLGNKSAVAPHHTVSVCLPSPPTLPDPPANPPQSADRQPCRSSNQRAATPQVARNRRPARALPPGHQVVSFGLAPQTPGPPLRPSPPLPSPANPLQPILKTPAASRG